MRRRLTGVALAALTLGLTTLLFVGGPGSQWPRSLHHLWDLGHVALFFAAGALALRTSLGTWPLLRQVVVILTAAAVLGGASEWLQGGTNRSASLGDLERDLLGAAFALAWLSPAIKNLWPARRRAVRAVVLLGLCWYTAPAVLSLVDEVAAGADFPVLGDFERAFERERWVGSARFRISAEQARSGRRSLRVDLATTTYSGVTLKHFPGNWSGYTELAFSVFNPSNEPLELVCKVHDEAHRHRGYQYRDRFNRRLSVPSGWTDYTIPLAEIRAAPEEREMNLRRVATLQFFAVRLPEPRTIYLDALKLR